MRPLTQREIRSVAWLGLSVIVSILIRVMTNAPTVSVVTAETPAILERRLAKARQIAATVPAKTQILGRVRDELQSREKNIMNVATEPEAQAHLLEVVRRISIQDKIQLRGSDFSPPALLGIDYGQVLVAISFETTIDAYVNFLSDLSREPELIGPLEIHIGGGNPAIKAITVRMTVAGVVPRKLVPVKKGFGTTI